MQICTALCSFSCYSSRTFIRVLLAFTIPTGPARSLEIASAQQPRASFFTGRSFQAPAGSRFRPYGALGRRSLLPMLLPHRVGATPSLRSPRPNLRGGPGATAYKASLCRCLPAAFFNRRLGLGGAHTNWQPLAVTVIAPVHGARARRTAVVSGWPPWLPAVRRVPSAGVGPPKAPGPSPPLPPAAAAPAQDQERAGPATSTNRRQTGDAAPRTAARHMPMS